MAGIPARILAGIPVGILAEIPAGMPAGISSGILAGIPAGIQAGIPALILLLHAFFDTKLQIRQKLKIGRFKVFFSATRRNISLVLENYFNSFEILPHFFIFWQ